jgi:hypothetical protein
MWQKVIKFTVLTVEEEAICVTFRKSTLLSLDDCLFALRETIPNLSRSSLHRLFQRNGISKSLNRIAKNIEDRKDPFISTSLKSEFVAIERQNLLMRGLLKMAGRIESAEFLQIL